MDDILKRGRPRFLKGGNIMLLGLPIIQISDSFQKLSRNSKNHATLTKISFLFFVNKFYNFYPIGNVYHRFLKQLYGMELK